MKKLIVILAAIAMVGSFTATAMADVELYGSARFRTYWQDVDNGTDDDKDLEWRMGHLSRFGANFKSDKITGKFELDARAGRQGVTDNIESGSQASSLGNIRLRHLWGEYDFGNFQLMIGQNFPLFDAPASSINYYSGGLQPLGGMGYTDARTSQLRLTFGNLRIAFLPPDTSKAVDNFNLLEEDPNFPFEPNTAGPYEGIRFADADTTLPKIEIRYDMKMDMGELNFIAGWQTFDVEGTVSDGVNEVAFDDSIDSYVLGFRGKFNIGGPLYANLAASYRVNGGPYDVWSNSQFENPTFDASGDLQDAESYGLVLALGYKVNDMLNLEASAAMLHSELDTDADNEDDSMAYGLQAKITVAPGVYIIPEFIYQDNDDITVNNVTNDNQGDNTILGVFWMINFK